MHDWNVSPQEAIAIQQELRQQLRLEPLGAAPRLIGGVDISYNRFSDQAFAAVVLLEGESMAVTGYAGAQFRMTFPYVPGLLSFREIPALLEAWKLLPVQPDVLLVDGHGIMHPRRLGLATHLGLLTGVAALGCGKSRLLGHYEEPGESRGSYAPLFDGGDLLGHVLRTKDRVKPMFISPGHRIDFTDARSLALHCARGYRLPEPTRQAHLTVNALRRGEWPLGWQPR